ANLARDVATKVAAVRRSFPQVKVGDIEPLGVNDPADWLDEIAQWTLAYRTAVGEPLAFFDVDIRWAGPWREQLQRLPRQLHDAGIKFGIIYDGDPDDQTDVAWT